MEPVEVISLHLDDLTTYEAIKDAVQKGWDCTKEGSYKVSVIAGQNSRVVPIARIDQKTPIASR